MTARVRARGALDVDAERTWRLQEGSEDEEHEETDEDWEDGEDWEEDWDEDEDDDDEWDGGIDEDEDKGPRRHPDVWH